MHRPVREPDPKPASNQAHITAPQSRRRPTHGGRRTQAHTDAHKRTQTHIRTCAQTRVRARARAAPRHLPHLQHGEDRPDRRPPARHDGFQQVHCAVAAPAVTQSCTHLCQSARRSYSFSSLVISESNQISSPSLIRSIVDRARSEQRASGSAGHSMPPMHRCRDGRPTPAHIPYTPFRSAFRSESDYTPFRSESDRTHRYISR
jgi:hypothetical protein